MLAQILRDLYVDPEILAELDEEQKQILFVRMREEQVKRWTERESELERQEKLNPPKPRLKKANAKSVHYLIAKDGNPWVWVLGEDEEEKSFSKILAEMEKRDDDKDVERAKELAHKEAEERLKKKRAEENAERERELREIQELKEKEEKVAQEKAKLEAEMKRLEEEARIAAQQAEEERRRLEEKRKEEEKKRQEEQRREEERKREEERRKEDERIKRERELAHQKAEEAWKRAREKAAEEARLQKLEEDKKRREAEEKRREEERRRQEELARLKAAEEARIKQEQEAKLKAKKLEEEKKKLEAEQLEAARKRKEELERIRAQRKAEKERREREIEEQERTRAKEIYMSLKQVREAGKKKEMEERQKEEEAWRAREKAAKQHEQQRRSSVSLARREVKRDREMVQKRLSEVPGNNNKAVAPPLPRRPSVQARPQRPPPPVPNRPSDLRDRHKQGSPVITAPPVRPPERPQRTPKPKSREAVIEWFRNEELPKNICYEQDGKILPYFHGIISRQEAEELLLKKVMGSFLVRVSERVWGYTITYRAADRCKHYLVDTSDNTYQFFGHNQIAHASLSELIQFHKIRPISGLGQELLKLPCGQSKDPPDYEELLNSQASSDETFSTKF